MQLLETVVLCHAAILNVVPPLLFVMENKSVTSSKVSLEVLTHGKSHLRLTISSASGKLEHIINILSILTCVVK